ncbi:MAG TPA: peptidase T [Pseudogracilibacillus sp.]|nr:peptidase T [Pseudogracilibacillus sp.]
MKEKVIERLLRYAKVNTQSDETSDTTPSTEGQWDLAHMLVEELKEIGMEDVTIDERAYVMATLPENVDGDVPTIGWLAHLDTATEFTGENVNPQVWESYDGSDLLLNKEEGIVMTTEENEELLKYVGQTLITTDGTTLLGADNKAGIAEIMTAMEYLINNPSIPHGRLRVAFTPDEEIGRGPHHFDVEKFNADFAYTVDGGPLGELQYESFNAAQAKITFYGHNVHPGTAKGKMIHAVKMANELINALPEREAPEYTEGYEGFYHLLSLEGTVEKAEVHFIIRDFDRETFNKRKGKISTLVSQLQERYGEEAIELQLDDQYFNMREKIEPVIEIIDTAKEAMNNIGITPVIEPIRGGTDGSQLSYMGLPTPNIFTGGENFHGKYEFASADHMVKAVEVIIEICRLFATKK